MFRQTFILILLFLFANKLLKISEGKTYRVYYTNVSTQSLSNELKLNSSVDKIAGSISLYVNVLTSIRKPYVNVLAHSDSGNGRYDLELLNRTINACMLFVNKKYEPLLHRALKTFEKDPGISMPARCPISKKLYFLKNMVIDSQRLPPVMPEKKIYVKLTFLSKDDTILKELGTHTGYVRIEKISRTNIVKSKN